MRNQVIVGLITTIAAASFAAPALADQVPAGANSPQIHISDCKVAKSPKGYKEASCPLTAMNMGKQTIYLQYHSNLKTFEPITGGPFGAQSGIVGVPGTGKVMSVYPMKFAFKDKTVAQVRKNLKFTISNATGGALITAGTANGRG